MPKTLTKSYHIIAGYDPEDVAEQVNAYLARGGDLAGNLVVVRSGLHSADLTGEGSREELFYFVQAIRTGLRPVTLHEPVRTGGVEP